jgi:O-antigen ligase
VLVGLYLVLLVCIPAVWVVGPLGAVGSPAGLVSCLMFAVWALGQMLFPATGRTTTAVHRLLLGFAAAFAAALVVAALRPMLAVEYSAAIRGVVAICGWLGIALFVAEAVRSRAQLYSVIRLVVGMGTVLAVLGFVQFATGLDFVNNLHVPGLSLNSSAVTVYQRAGFARVNATTMHAIEFATVLSMILPLAVSQVLRRRTATALVQAILIGGALPLTVARSGMLGLALGLTFAFLVVEPRTRLAMLAMLPVGIAGFVAVAPGLLGTIRDLFLAADTDTSISARTDDYPAVEALFREAPWFGRGPFTYLPSIYRTLDNQYLGSLVEGGLIGLAALLALIVVPVTVGVRLARRLPGREDRVLCLALAAGFVVAAVLFSTFDAFSFPTAMGVLFLLLGLVAAATRVLPEEDCPAGPRHRPAGSRMRQLWVSAAAALAVLAIGGVVLHSARPAYEARGTVALAVPGQAGQNIYYGKLEIAGVSDLVLRVMDDAGTRAVLAAQGHGEFQIAAANGSLAPFTEVRGSGDVLTISATAADPDGAAAAAQAVLRQVEQTLSDLQSSRGVDPAVQVAVVESFRTPEVSELPVHRVLGVPGLLVLAGAAAACVHALLARCRRRAQQR